MVQKVSFSNILLEEKLYGNISVYIKLHYRTALKLFIWNIFCKTATGFKPFCI